MKNSDRFERPALAVIAVVAWFAVILQYYVLWVKPVLSGMNAIQLTFLFFNYFTILTNTLVAVSTSVSLFAPQSAPGRFFSGINARTAVALYISLVSVVFNVLLRDIDIREGFADNLANELTHLFIPVMYFLFWLLIVPKGSLNWHRPIYWLIYPVFYLVWVGVYGASTGRYPYPFLDVGSLGYSSVLVNAVGLTTAFFIVGELFVGIDRWLGRKRAV